MVHVRDYLGDRRIVRPERAPSQPAVSVVLPTWRRFASGTLQRALESVLGQSFRDLELIVVDDGSTDGTWDYLTELQASDPRLVLVRHERNSGLPAIRTNEGIELSRGRHVAFQFDDDEWLDGALEMLVGRAESLKEPSVVYGQALLLFPEGRAQVTLPDRDVNVVTLFRENFLANNSMLVPRSVLEEFGLYDCHIGMRRICDWDLWVRLIRHVPFVAAGGAVSRVHVPSDPSALRLTAPSDFQLVRFLMALPRDGLLSLARWHDYQIDALRIADAEIPRGLRQRLVEEQIRPYYQRQGLSGGMELSTEPPPGARTLACLLHGSYPSSVLCFGRYDELTRARGTYVRFEQLVDQLAPTWTAETDLALFVRPLTEPVPELARQAVAAGIPAGYYLDDDMLHLYEYGARYAAFAPGQPFHSNLVSALQQVDAVWATSPAIAEAVRPHNTRIVPHSGAVPEEWLPDRLRKRGAGGRIRIAHAGSSYRDEEFQAIWDGLRRIAREFPGEVEFEFWGVDVGGLPALDAPVFQFPYNFSYEAHATRMRRSGMDILLTPLLDRPRPRLAKSPSKYYEVATAGAFGIFSDVPPYAALPHGLTCLKAENTAEAWYEAMREAIRMPEERFDTMRRRLIEHVRLEYTGTALIHLHEAACHATEAHRRMRGHRHPDGWPRVLVIEGADGPPARELSAVLRRYSIEPVAGPGDGPAPARGWEDFLARERPALALVPREPTAGARSCRERGVPLLPMPEVVVPHESFARGLSRLLRDIGAEDSREPLVVAIRNGIAGGRLPGLPETAVVRWFDARETPDLGEVDILVAPAEETALLARAAAEGVLRVVVPAAATDAAAVKGIQHALGLTAEEGHLLRTAAYRAARATAHPDAVANDLLRRFNEVVEKTEVPQARVPVVEAPPAPPAADLPSARARLKDVLERVGLYRPLSRLYWKARRKRVLVVDVDTVADRDPRDAAGQLEAATGRTWIFRSTEQVDPRNLYSFECVMFRGGVSEESLRILEAAKGFGCATVCACDGDLARTLASGAPGAVREVLRGVDLVLAPSEEAAAVFRRLNPHVAAIVPFDGEGNARRMADLLKSLSMRRAP